MNIVNLPALVYRRESNLNLTIETTRTLDGRVKLISHIGSSHHNDIVISAKSIHFNKDLVESTITFVIRTHLLVTLFGNSIDFVNENNSRRVSLCLLK